MDPIRFICYKWGNKYPSIYVNRLYAMIKKNYDKDFVFHCITDNINGIRNEVITHDINEIAPFRKNMGSIFTVEKISSFKPGFLGGGQNVLLDLDIIIHGNLTEYLDKCFVEFRLIKNYWQSDYADITHYGGNYCSINSSFVTWKDEQASHIYDFYIKNLNKISRIYNSFDRSLYYLQEGKYAFHPKGIVYSYNGGAQHPNDRNIGLYRDAYKICIFNNSHGYGLDITNTKNWALEMWNNYDTL